MSQNQIRIPRSHRRRRDAAGPRAGPRPVRRMVVLSAAAVLTAVFIAVTQGSTGRAYALVDFGSGVLSLVCLTATVLWGLAATDRFLGPGHRIVAQAVHRGTAIGGLGTLALHVWVKVEQKSTTASGAAVPFTDAAQPVLVGYGTLAAYIFLAVAVTGAVRGAFAGSGRSRWWRALHMCAYVAWGLAVVHGLRAGRPTFAWVTAAYALSLVAVAVALGLRLLPGRNPRLKAVRRTPDKTARAVPAARALRPSSRPSPRPSSRPLSRLPSRPSPRRGRGPSRRRARPARGGPHGKDAS